MLVARVDYADGDPERYVLPLAVVGDGRPVPAQSVVAALRTGDGDAPLVDATAAGAPARALLQALADSHRVPGLSGGVVEATPYAPIEPPDDEPRDIGAAHAAASVRYGDRYLLKVFRRLEEGVSPELEMTRFLDEHAPGLTPPVVGIIEHQRPRAEPRTLAVLQAYVPNEGSAWTHAIGELGRYFERVLTRHRDAPPPDGAPLPLLDSAQAEPPPAVAAVIGAYRDSAALLGRRTAEMHLALASRPDEHAFRPEPYAPLDSRSKYQSMRNLVGKTLRALRGSLARMPARALHRARLVADSQERMLRLFDPMLTRRISGLRIRTHGDYHLGQVLYTGKDFVIIDFDGPPAVTLAERRRKHSALRDVAAMIRSYHLAAHSGLLDSAVVREEDRTLAAPWADAWQRWVSGAFLRAYLDTTRDAPFMPDPEDLAFALTAQVLGRAFHELADELPACAETVSIPLAAIVELVGL
jgi:maltose alpha-D-glucosyltransferase/alpha-amylase